jgi:hypothetical protein
MRYKMFEENPPEGWDAPDPDVMQVIDTLLDNEDTWFFLRGMDESLAEGLDAMVSTDDRMMLDVVPSESEEGFYMRVRFEDEPFAEPVSDD